ncbi:hypothetical protein R3P38DRAFT_2768638 [Favolaschia claudopus]|uniref:Uncharacterized protein n=1 Tax=Favolaschia claudopus TaxID=2862362 RepID=A0AAW0CT28_9AGAR
MGPVPHLGDEMPGDKQATSVSLTNRCPAPLPMASTPENVKLLLGPVFAGTAFTTYFVSARRRQDTLIIRRELLQPSVSGVRFAYIHGAPSFPPVKVTLPVRPNGVPHIFQRP